MRSLGVIEDRFTFTEAEIARGRPRFWWGARKWAAYHRVLEARGVGRRGRDRDRERDDGAEPDTAPGTDRRDTSVAGTAAVATVALAEALPEKRLEGGGSWFRGGADGGGGSSDGGTSSGGTSSGGSGSDGGGGGSGE